MEAQEALVTFTFRQNNSGIIKYHSKRAASGRCRAILSICTEHEAKQNVRERDTSRCT